MATDQKAEIIFEELFLASAITAVLIISRTSCIQFLFHPSVKYISLPALISASSQICEFVLQWSVHQETITAIFIWIIIFGPVRVDSPFTPPDHFAIFVFDRAGKVTDVNSRRHIENSIKCIIPTCTTDRAVFCEGIDVLYFCIDAPTIIFTKSRRCTQS